MLVADTASQALEASSGQDATVKKGKGQQHTNAHHLKTTEQGEVGWDRVRLGGECVCVCVCV